MKAKSLIFFLIIGSMSLASYSSAQAQNRYSDKQAIALLKEFYTAYITESSKLPTLTNLAKVEAIQKKYCTTSLLKKINAQFKSGHVDADPFIFAQDVDVLWLKTMSFNKDLKRVNGYTVSYMQSIPNEKIVIHLTVIKQGDGLKIASIR
ncbi:MAG TPA: hypothetical protein VEZ17_17705 [Chitinophagaceae bacterium]|jgi:hypothetical protein|nr:hypothetical protein [Chitinophagaceae bacterium]